jgi:hypothetical protein
MAVALLGFFGLTLVTMYIAIRRYWLAVPVIAVGGIVVNVVLVTLFALAQAMPGVYAVLLGLLLGGGASLVSLTMALYFQRGERAGAVEWDGNQTAPDEAAWSYQEGYAADEELADMPPEAYEGYPATEPEIMAYADERFN